MQLGKVRLVNDDVHVAVLEDETAHLLDLSQVNGYQCLSDILHAPDPKGLAHFLIDTRLAPVPLQELTLLAPIDAQEVWAAGVTYRRSQVARMEESDSGASHYDKVYTADRPELFFKATAARVSGPGQPVRVRRDSRWTVPEPELTLVITPGLKLVGFTAGNDMSARDIEGENPLYLPQAKVYDQCCALGPAVWIPETPIDRATTSIRLLVERQGRCVVDDATTLEQMVRNFDDLIAWLGRENSFPNGAFLLTGTGIIPPDNFTLIDGDTVSIDIAGIGRLTNPVVQTAPQ